MIGLALRLAGAVAAIMVIIPASLFVIAVIWVMTL